MPRPGEVLIRVAAAGVNRPDVMQRRGAYPPPPGASDIPGLEVAGRLPRSASGCSAGGRAISVCALVSGGGYATLCVAPAPQCLPPPAVVDMVGGGGHSRDLFHRLVQRLRARPAAGRRDGALPRRHQRHRHHGDSAGRGQGRACIRHGRLRRKVSRLRSSSARRTRSTTAPTDFVEAIRALTERPRRRSHPGHHGRKLHATESGGAGGRRPSGADRVDERRDVGRRSTSGASSDGD